MRTIDMREKLDKFCHTMDSCSECPLEKAKSGCRCGCGVHFLSKVRNSDKYDMSNKEIHDAYRIVFPEEEKNVPNPYWDNITKIANAQREKGLKEYGQGLEHNIAPVLDRIQHIEEELVDTLMYLEWLKESLEDV